MNAPNIMRHYVTTEPGTSATLATILDPDLGRPAQRAFWGSFASLLALDLPEGGPSRVLLEFKCIDLVVLWGDWALAIENKVLSGSIRRGQLEDYYAVLCSEVSEGQLAKLGARRICIVFLTPTAGEGHAEFDSLEISREQDDKVHLSWDHLLRCAREAWSRAADGDPAKVMIMDALALTAGLLEKNERTLRATPRSPERLATEAFVRELKDAVLAVPNFGSIEFCDWMDPNVNEVYARPKGLIPTGNLYFLVFPEGTDLTPPGADASVRFNFKLKIVGGLTTRAKGSSPADRAAFSARLDATRRRFKALAKAQIAATLDLPLERLDLDTRKFLLTYADTYRGTRQDIFNRIVATFSAFLGRLGTFLSGSPEAPGQPSIVG